MPSRFTRDEQQALLLTIMTAHGPDGMISMYDIQVHLIILTKHLFTINKINKD